MNRWSGILFAVSLLMSALAAAECLIACAVLLWLKVLRDWKK